MSYSPYIVEVKGNNIAKEECHYAQDWVAMTASEYCNCCSVCWTNKK